MGVEGNIQLPLTLIKEEDYVFRARMRDFYSFNFNKDKVICYLALKEIDLPARTVSRLELIEEAAFGISKLILTLDPEEQLYFDWLKTLG